MILSSEIPFEGYGPATYSVSYPEQLPGRHAKAIQSELLSDEVIEHLVVCPMWDCTRKPFGIQAPRASHVLCLTPHRLIISRDRHVKKSTVHVLSYRRDQLAGFQLGQALLMSWLALHMKMDETVACEALFFPRLGNEHIIALMLKWRADWSTCSTYPMESLGESFRGLDRLACSEHADMFQSLLIPGENCIHTYDRPALWGNIHSRLKKKPVCLGPATSLFISSHAFFCARDAVPLGVNGLVFSFDMLCFSLALPRRIYCRSVREAGLSCERLTIAFGIKEQWSIDCMFSSEHLHELRMLCQMLQRDSENGILLPIR